MTNPVFLAHRSVISVSGADAENFLNGIVTASTLGLRTGEFRYGGLLTPQGKVIGDMLLTREDDAVLIDCAEVAAASVVRRLTMMKLRAAVSIDLRPDLGVSVFEGAPDPRSLLAPSRRIGPRRPAGHASAWHAARIAAGLPEQGFDFDPEEVFPADINMDIVDGVDFRKGCFVGQEVVSRMKRRGTARRRTLKAQVDGTIQAPAPILASDFEIGMLTSISGCAALARVRIDRLTEARAKGETITAGGVAIVFDDPPWLAGELAAMNEGKA
jgi:folate-binding protein YgfZ